MAQAILAAPTGIQTPETSGAFLEAPANPHFDIDIAMDRLPWSILDFSEYFVRRYGSLIVHPEITIAQLDSADPDQTTTIRFGSYPPDPRLPHNDTDGQTRYIWEVSSRQQVKQLTVSPDGTLSGWLQPERRDSSVPIESLDREDMLITWLRITHTLTAPEFIEHAQAMGDQRIQQEIIEARNVKEDKLPIAEVVLQTEQDNIRDRTRAINFAVLAFTMARARSRDRTAAVGFLPTSLANRPTEAQTPVPVMVEQPSFDWTLYEQLKLVYDESKTEVNWRIDALPRSLAFIVYQALEQDGQMLLFTTGDYRIKGGIRQVPELGQQVVRLTWQELETRVKPVEDPNDLFISTRA